MINPFPGPTILISSILIAVYTEIFGGSNSYGGGSFAFLVFQPYQRFCINSASTLDLRMDEE